MPTFEHSTLIDGVILVHLDAHPDDRGRLVETYRHEWFPDSPPMVQSTRSDSVRGVIRAMHYHRRQADYWHVPRGRIHVGLHDLRRGSDTTGTAQALELQEDEPMGLYIPPGVAHGFQAVTNATLTYLVDRYYDSSDEFGVAWDDVNIRWPIDDPLLSERDRTNPRLDEIRPEDLP